MSDGITQIKDIIINSVKLVGRHFYLYFIPLAYLVIGAIIVSAIGFIGLSFVLGVSLASLMDVKSIPQFISLIATSISVILLMYFILAGALFTGYLGGIGQMLKALITTRRITFSDFMSGAFRHGPRLFSGLVLMSILLLIPAVLGMNKLLNMYGVYDFATMNSGWNSNLRQSIGQAHSGVVMWTYVVQIIIAFLFSFWWVICIAETKAIFTSFIRSAVFVVKNPAGSLIVLIFSAVGITLLSYILMMLFQTTGTGSDMGGLLGVYLMLPLVFLVILQFYDKRYRQAIQAYVNPETEAKIETEPKLGSSSTSAYGRRTDRSSVNRPGSAVGLKQKQKPDDNADNVKFTPM